MKGKQLPVKVFKQTPGGLLSSWTKLSPWATQSNHKSSHSLGYSLYYIWQLFPTNSGIMRPKQLMDLSTVYKILFHTQFQFTAITFQALLVTFTIHTWCYVMENIHLSHIWHRNAGIDGPWDNPVEMSIMQHSTIPVILSYDLASQTIPDRCLSISPSARTQRSSLILESVQFPAIRGINELVCKQKKMLILRLNHSKSIGIWR